MIGMIPFFGAFFLEENDNGYNEYLSQYYVDVPIITGKYNGELTASQLPVDIDDYNKWISSFPTKKILYPFVIHQICFELEHLDNLENVLFCFEWGLALSHQNFIQNTKIPVNQDIGYLKRIQHYKSNLHDKEKRINDCYKKSKELFDVDLTQVQTVEVYNVK